MIVLNFFGPFSWRGNAEAQCIFASDISQKRGVYLWTVSVGSIELIYYVGETGRSFGARMLEHFREHCSGGYHLYSPVDFRRGAKVPLWPGRYDSHAKTSVTDFIDKANDLWPVILELIDIYRFFCAPLELDRRMRERIESGIASHLYNQGGLAGNFQDTGIRYRPRTQRELPTPISIRPLNRFHGLPSVLEV